MRRFLNWRMVLTCSGSMSLQCEPSNATRPSSSLSSLSVYARISHYIKEGRAFLTCLIEGLVCAHGSLAVRMALVTLCVNGTPLCCLLLSAEGLSVDSQITTRPRTVPLEARLVQRHKLPVPQQPRKALAQHGAAGLVRHGQIAQDVHEDLVREAHHRLRAGRAGRAAAAAAVKGSKERGQGRGAALESDGPLVQRRRPEQVVYVTFLPD